MPKYNLDALGSQEFERLCQSLVQQIIGQGAKVYGMGSDGAREATFHGKAPYPSKEEQWGGSWIFQAKFHDVQQIGPKKAREAFAAELKDELLKITEKYKHPCDNFILMTNVSLTPVFQRGMKDRIDNEIIPKYPTIKHIHVWGAEEICRFLDAYPMIRQTYAHLLVSGDLIACLLRLIEREETELDELVKLYCQGCYDHEQYAALDDAGDVEDERVALQRVFIDLDVKPPTLPQDLQVLERLPEWMKQAAEDDDRTSALSYLLDDSILGLVLTGGPGEGKSTLGQYLAQIHRTRLIGRVNELDKNLGVFENFIPRIPFKILLREYAQWISSRSNSDSLFHYLALQVSQESGRDTNPEDIHKIIKSSPILLILDGLDEVPEKRLRTRVLDNVTSFVHQVRNVLKGNLRVIATTRPYGYSQEFDPVHYLHLNLQKLSSEKADFYAGRWTEVREPNPREAERIRDTFSMCLKDKVVSVLTQTPLQVTILLVIIRARGTPPKQREELFERYTDIIYQREQKKRPELLRTEPDVIYGLHKYLAYTLHKRTEKDNTAALMDVSEFRERVKEYLIHSNPLLNEEELETKANQIIREASQRLVLIESPIEGKVGFGLTTTREFFAAAHLVDTAKDTKERDLRFKAIARSPHWRNVALFFAGRVGRTRPGEAPSMIDVCREIDTEGVDKFLKRGAELVMGMVDDRVLREPHNEIGAIQYGLTLLDSGYIRGESDELLNKLKSLPDEYKERIIRPLMEKRLNNVIPENLMLHAEIYQKLFGMTEPLHDAIKRASEYDSKDVKLWVLSQAIKNKIAEPWVMEKLEELLDLMSTEKLAGTLAYCWPNFRFYLNFSLSRKARTAVALALLEGIDRHESPFEPLSQKAMAELSMIKPEGKLKENSLLLWAVSQLLILSRLSVLAGRHRREWPIQFDLPGITNPNVKAMINKNRSIIEEFCKTFSDENEPFIKFLITVFQFLLEPHNPEKYIAISKQLQLEEKSAFLLIRIVQSFFRLPPDAEEEMYSYHNDLYTLYKHYKSEDQYKKDIEELNEIINKNSKSIRNHPYKLFIWINSACDPAVEKFLDSEILNTLKVWLQERDLTEKALGLYWWSIMWKSDLELCELVLEIVARQLAEGQKRLKVDHMIAWYEWHELKTKQELMIASRLKRIFEEILANYSTLMDPHHRYLEILYWSALGAGVVEEKHMTTLYEIIHKEPDFPSMPWLAERAKSAWPTLVNMLQSDNQEVAHLAAIILLKISRGSIRDEHKRIKEAWVGDKYWAFAQDKGDVWRPRYIEGMAQCQLKWAENGQEWLKAIEEANTEELQSAWCRVLEKADFCNAKGQNAFSDSLIHILESGDTFAKPIRLAALRRLGEMVSLVEPVGLDEKSLNLPLSRRTGTSFS